MSAIVVNKIPHEKGVFFTVDPEKVLQDLMERGIVAINEKGRVTYSKAGAVPQPPSVLSRHDEIPF